jgi:hypothetical protein
MLGVDDRNVSAHTFLLALTFVTAVSPLEVKPHVEWNPDVAGIGLGMFFRPGLAETLTSPH